MLFRSERFQGRVSRYVRPREESQRRGLCDVVAMKSNAFTFQAKYADALKGLPEEAQAEFALAIINYGCYGE